MFWIASFKNTFKDNLDFNWTTFPIVVEPLRALILLFFFLNSEETKILNFL